MMDPPRCRLSSCVMDVEVCNAGQREMINVSSLTSRSLGPERTYEVDMSFDLGELVYRSIAFSVSTRIEALLSLCLDSSGLSSIDQQQR